MKQYNLIRNIFLGTAVATTHTVSPTVAVSMDGSAPSYDAASSLSSSVRSSFRKANVGFATTTSMATATNSNPAYEQAVRHLGESQSQDALDHCSGHTTAMITCLLTQCVGQEPCEQQQQDESSHEGRSFGSREK